MKKGRFKEEYEKEHFTVRVDVTNLYKLKLEADSLKRLTRHIKDPRLKTASNNINQLCSIMNGEMVIADLKGEVIKAKAVLEN